MVAEENKFLRFYQLGMYNMIVSTKSVKGSHFIESCLEALIFST